MATVAQRNPPLDERELYIVAALLYSPDFRQWFRGMNIGPAVLSSDNARTIAAWACTDQMTFTPQVEAAMIVRDGDCMTIGEWVVAFCGEELTASTGPNDRRYADPKFGTPPESIDRQARVRCAWLWKRWLPAILHHACANPNDRNVFSAARTAVDWIDETLNEAPSPFTENA